MVILPENGTETTIPSHRTFVNFRTIHTVNLLDFGFLLTPVYRTDIDKSVMNKSQSMSVVLPRYHLVKALGLVCWIDCTNCLVGFTMSEPIFFSHWVHAIQAHPVRHFENWILINSNS